MNRRDGVAGFLVGVGGPGGQLVCGAVDVGVLVGVEVGQPVDDRLRLLRGGGVVEPDQRLAVDRLAQDREVGAHRVDVENLVVVRQSAGRARRGLAPDRSGSSSSPRHPPGRPSRRADQPRSATVGAPGGQPGTEPRGATGTLAAVPASTPGIVGTMPERHRERVESALPAAGRVRHTAAAPTGRGGVRHIAARRDRHGLRRNRLPAQAKSAPARTRRSAASNGAAGGDTDRPRPPRRYRPTSPPSCRGRCPAARRASSAAGCPARVGRWRRTTGWPAPPVRLR